MERKISALSGGEHQYPFDGEQQTYDVYRGEHSWEVRADGDYTDVCFDVALLRGETLRVRWGDWECTLECSKELRSVSLPYLGGFDYFELEGECYAAGNLRLVREEMPQDVLRGFERMGIPLVSLGEVHVRREDEGVRVPSWVRDDCTLVMGGRRYHARDVVAGVARIRPDDYDGELFLEVPVRIGYYDQDMVVPQVMLWFSSPDPEMRGRRGERRVLVNGEWYVREHTQSARWGVRLECFGNTPEEVQALSTHVRHYLERNRIYVNGRAFTFEWTQPVSDVEPARDVLPSCAYEIQLSVQEEMEWRKERSGKPTLAISPHSRASTN